MQMDDAGNIAERALNSEELATLIRAAVADGTTIRFSAPGKSMAPFIQSGDKIFVAPVAKGSIHAGDILAFVHPQNGRVLAHRVVKLSEGRIFCKGDNVGAGGDGWITYQDVLGRVVRVQRKEKEIHLGLGLENGIIAQLSRWKLLVPLLNFLRRIKWGIIRLFSFRAKRSP